VEGRKCRGESGGEEVEGRKWRGGSGGEEGGRELMGVPSAERKSGTSSSFPGSSSPSLAGSYLARRRDKVRSQNSRPGRGRRRGRGCGT